MENNLLLLENMINDLNKNIHKKYVSDYWKNYSFRIQKNIKKYGLDSFRSNFLIGDGFSDIIHDDPFLHKHETFKNKIRGILGSLISRSFPFSILIDQPYKNLSNSYINNYLKAKSELINLKNHKVLHQFFSKHKNFDTLQCQPRDTFVFNDNKIGNSYLSPILTKNIISNEFKKRKYNSFFEIGGGFGANAHTLLSTVPKLKKYIYMDIPPMLYIGTQYLRNFFNSSLYDYDDINKLDTITFKKNDDIEIYCLAPWQLNKVKSNVDFFFNAHSFQEISFEILNDYSLYLKKIMNKNNSIILQFYEYFPEVQNTNDPLKIIDLLNQNCNFNLSKKSETINIESKSFIMTNFVTDSE